VERQVVSLTRTVAHGDTGFLYPIYTMQPFVKPVVQPVHNRLYRVNGALGRPSDLDRSSVNGVRVYETGLGFATSPWTGDGMM